MTSGVGRMFTLLTLAFLVVPSSVKGQQDPVPAKLSLAVGKSLLVESSLPIERVSIGYGEIAEATAVGPDEILVNGRNPGITSLIVWQRGGGKLFYDVTVRPGEFAASSRVEAIERELSRELPGQGVEVSYENETVFLRGRVKDAGSAQRAVAIASTLGRTVNLLYVNTPPAEDQVLLKVRFATIDRSAGLQLGFNLASTGAGNTVGGVTTQQFSPPQVSSGPTGVTAAVSDALNIFLLRPDLNLLATIQALQQKSVMEILAEPNVLAMNGKEASFLAGGEFPYPTFQSSAGGVGAVTIQFREFGVRLNFTPNITPRGTIRLQVAPEVSALDFTSGLVVQGFNVPALIVRKVNTEIELSPGQSFAIGGLIDNRLTETISKIPVLGDAPILGKLFQSKLRTKQNTELIIIVTPELVAPLSPDAPVPSMDFPSPPQWPRTTSGEANVPATRKTGREAVPAENLMKTVEPSVRSGTDRQATERTPFSPATPPPK